MGKLSRNDKMLKLLRNRKIMRSCYSFIGRGGAHLPPERELLVKSGCAGLTRFVETHQGKSTDAEPATTPSPPHATIADSACA